MNGQRTRTACLVDAFKAKADAALPDINARLLLGRTAQVGRAKGNAEMALKMLDMGRIELAREFLVEAVNA